jgi:polyhydroxybutyrate depolymerase
MNRITTVALAVAAVMMALAAGCRKKNSIYYPPESGYLVTPGDHSASIEHDGLTRTFKYHVPSSWTYGAEQPLVFALHGGGGSSDDMITLTEGGFDLLSEVDGFIVVYPDAYDKNWNDGRGLDCYDSMLYDVDDVGFILALIEYFDDRANIDRSRVYSTGVSNGSFMSYRLAIEASDSFAAIAPVVGLMTENLWVLTPQAPVPVCIMVGLEDPCLPAEGGYITSAMWGTTGLGSVVSAASTVDFWVAHNGCNPSPTVTPLPDVSPDDGTLVTRFDYANTANGAQVVYYEITGGGHTWPNGWGDHLEWLFGNICEDMDGNTVIWSFFKLHSK